MFKIVSALCLVAVATGALVFEDDVAEALQTFDTYQVGKDGQFNTCNSKTFAMVMDSDKYGTDKNNMAKYCAMYCRVFVDEDTTHVNLDDRSDKGGTHACYCSNDCNDVCEGTPTYERTTLEVEAVGYDPIAWYYNYAYYYGSSYSSYTFPYYDDSQFGRFYSFNSGGPNSGSYMYYYYYYGGAEGQQSWTMNGYDYAYDHWETTETISITFDQWTIDCDDGDMDLANNPLSEQYPDYTFDDGTGTDYSDFTRFDFAEGLADSKDQKCLPVHIFQRGAVSHGLTWPNQEQESNWYGIPEETANGIAAMCANHVDRDSCEGFKMYGYGGYTCGSSSSDSNNFGYSYYYDGTSIYHGSDSTCFDFNWELQDQGVYAATFTYYYYYYYSYVYVCDWTYDYEFEVDTGISSPHHASWTLFAVVDQ